MIPDKRISELEELGFEVTNRGVDENEGLLTLEYEGTEEEFYQKLPAVWDPKDIKGFLDEPTIGKVQFR